MADQRVKMASHMALWAFRYALGRMSYCPSMVQEELRRVWPAIHCQDRSTILRDLEEEIARDDRSRERGGKCHPLGSDRDREGWIRFRDWITEQAKEVDAA